MKRRKAAALKYDKTTPSPVVTAVGFGHVADEIVKRATENNIPVIENSELVESLSKIPPGQNIPLELYEAAAEVIAFIYSLNNKK
jgi:flagellar biosynthesis protein